MNRTLRLGRRDQTRAVGEAWRPPAFVPARTRRARLVAQARRFLDLQAGSICAIWPPCCRVASGPSSTSVAGHNRIGRCINAETRYIGIDTADAKERFGYHLPETVYFSGDVWPVESATVDFLISTETLEHVPCPTRFLAEAFRCLKPGGQLLLTVPFAARWHYIPHDYWRYTPSSLTLLLKDAGFRDVSVYSRGNAFTVACYKVMALLLPLLLPQGRSRTAAVFLAFWGSARCPFCWCSPAPPICPWAATAAMIVWDIPFWPRNSGRSTAMLEMRSRRCPVCRSGDESRIFAEANLDPRKIGRFTFASRKLPEYMHCRLVECPICDLLYSSPAPTVAAITTTYREAAFDSGEESRRAGALTGDSWTRCKYG